MQPHHVTCSLRRGSVQHQTVVHLAEAGPQSTNATLKAVMGENALCLLAEFKRDILDRLAADGLIQRTGRHGKWAITPQGHEALQALDAHLEGAAVAATVRSEAIEEACGIDVRLLTTGRPRLQLRSAESTPPRLRPEASEYEAWPSRQGSRLVYRSGRVTDLQGNQIQEARA